MSLVFGPVYPGTAQNDAIGSTGTSYYHFNAWLNINNIKAEDLVPATASLPSGSNFFTARDRDVFLMVSGVQLGTDQTNPVPNNIPTSPTLFTYGIPTDTWGASLTPAIVNDPAFGWQWQAQVTLGIGGTPYLSDHALATNFGFNLPPDAVIVGVVGETNFWSLSPSVTVRMDFMRLTLYYTGPNGPSMQGVQSTTRFGTITF